MRQIAGYIFSSNNRFHCLQQVLVNASCLVTGFCIANIKSSNVDGKQYHNLLPISNYHHHQYPDHHSSSAPRTELKDFSWFQGI